MLGEIDEINFMAEISSNQVIKTIENIGIDVPVGLGQEFLESQTRVNERNVPIYGP